MKTYLSISALLLSAATGAAQYVPEPPSSAAVVIDFDRNRWEPSVHGTVTAGAPVGVHYDGLRLPRCRTTNRNTAWSIEMHYRFDDGEIQSIFVQGAGAPDRVHDIAVPADARTLTVWFENYDLINNGQHGDRDKPCRDWDSVFGANYTFQIAP
jgi:hypothetical protein